MGAYAERPSTPAQNSNGVACKGQRRLRYQLLPSTKGDRANCAASQWLELKVPLLKALDSEVNQQPENIITEEVHAT